MSWFRLQTRSFSLDHPHAVCSSVNLCEVESCELDTLYGGGLNVQTSVHTNLNRQPSAVSNYSFLCKYPLSHKVRFSQMAWF